MVENSPYRRNLLKVLEEFLQKSPSAASSDSFNAKFDEYIDQEFRKFSEPVVLIYPILKIHNLWAAPQSKLPKIKIQTMDNAEMNLIYNRLQHVSNIAEKWLLFYVQGLIVPGDGFPKDFLQSFSGQTIKWQDVSLIHSEVRSLLTNEELIKKSVI